MTSSIDEIVHTARSDGLGIRLVHLADGTPPDVLEQAERALLSLGFVTMPVVASRSKEICASLGRRHVAIVCRPGDDRAIAAWWIRWLGRSSPRGHLVVVVGHVAGPGIRTAREAVARERAPCHQPPADRGARAPVWLRRAESCCRRRRFAAAQRWFQAAIASAERRGDEAMASRAGGRLVTVLVEQGSPQLACRLAFDLGERLAAWRPRADLLAVAGSALVAATELDRAEALLAALEAEAVVLGEDPPPACEALRAELACWRGRFDRVRHPICAGSLREAAWSGLAAWARGDAATLAAALDVVSHRAAGEVAAHEAGVWMAALGALAGRGGAVVPEPRGTQNRLGALAAAVSAEVSLSAGRPRQAMAALEGGHPPEGAPEAWLHAWLRSRCQPSNEGLRALEGRVRREGLDGVFRWGEGKGGMHLIHGLPALLQVVQDADDDQAALAGGCAWLRRQTGADEVAIVDADGAGVLVTDGWSGAVSRDEGTLGAPVRYGRAVIGHLLARGTPAAHAVIEQALPAVAALVGSAVRSRLDALALSRDAHRAAPEILGTSPGVAAVREAIARASQTGFPVLIEGESGTGKERVARAVHRLSARRDRPFAAVNCAALTDDLIEAELFGHARGAFTGALGTRTGLFEWAHGGTLFLDEVGELSPRGQAKLLRALQEREIRRLGENVARPVDIRVVAATNVALAEAALRGSFRQDLLFRLAVIRIRLPPLRNRVEDIPLLARAFWRQLGPGREPGPRLGPDALAAFCRHSWPGNVRELQNVVASLVVAAPAQGRVTERHVRQVLAAASADHGVPTHGDIAMSLTAARELAERRTVAGALARHGGRRSAAAMELGLSRQGLTKALRRLGLSSLDPKAGVA